MKTKKVLAVLLATLSLSCLCACSDEDGGDMKTFTSLSNNQTLHVGSNNVFTNITTTNTTDVYLTQVIEYEYTLERTSSSYYAPSNAIYYDDYYYYWSVKETTDEIRLGTKTETTTISFSYIAYGEDENIAVKGTSIIETSYDYSSGFINKSFTYSTNLNNYFSSFYDLSYSCPELASQIDTSGTKKYYIDATTPKITNYTINSYTNTYYYLSND